ncbi:hypothetical protein M231_04662 [Tremella mesenterica]|uniref:Uncharacterized protein n=1 Tax=Tremella mesenterica TaxID=5217 RepID=A0A4Q1BK24_TREME|nr:hypothetical protein M231_04662 [Tremella mesenterica]
MSSSSTIVSTGSTTTSSPSSSTTSSNRGGGGMSSSLYLFTFLITIVVLGLISAALLLRAFYIRRAFHRRVEEALQRGEALPEEAMTALGMTRPAKKKKLGPTPNLWETELLHPDSYPSDEWETFTPLGMVRFPPNVESTPPQVQTLPPFQPITRNFFRSVFRPTAPLPLTRRTDPVQPLAEDPEERSGPAFELPEYGEKVVLGVLISLPSESQVNWTKETDGDNVEIPEVCLGVSMAKISE